MFKPSLKGALIAATVANLFAASPSLAGDSKAKDGAKVVKCAGINECKGKGSCAGADNSCKSHNSCKGKGWVETKSAKQCTNKGGTVTTP
jgi:uncharacterized membrane protein